MADYIPFPEEIVCEILKRLSIDDAVRCTSVCKSWYSLITNPSFISLHSQHRIAASSTNNKDLVLVRDYCSKNPNKELYSLHFLDETFIEHRRLHFPIASFVKDSYFRVIGCVNGVICLSDDLRTYTLGMILWNPSIKKFLDLPTPIFTFGTHGGFMHTVGFGFNDAKNDFMVVRVVYLMDGNSMVPPMVEVFEPNAGTWREVDAKGFSHTIDERGRQVFLNGNVHWVIGCKDKYDFFKEPNDNNLIVSFDLKSEAFGVMKAPDSLYEYERKQDFCVSALGESLSLIHYSCSKYGNSSTCCVWVMKQYGESDSWTKLFNIDVRGGAWRVLGFQRNGEALVKAASIYDRLGNLVSFEPKSKKLKILAGFADWEPLYAHNFTETLALLGVKGDFVVDAELVGTNSPDEESCETDDDTDEESCETDDDKRCLDPANLSRPNNVPTVQVSWFG